MNRIDAALRRDDVETATHAARLLRQRQRQVRLVAAPDDDPAVAHVHLSLASLAVGETLRSIEDLTNAASVARHYPEGATIRRYIDAQFGLVHALRGSLRRAADHLHSAAVIPATVDAPDPFTHHTIDVARRLITAETLEPPIRETAPWDDLATVRGHAVLWPLRLLAQLRSVMNTDGPTTALEIIALSAATHRVEPGSLAADVITAETVRGLLLVGSVDEARNTIAAERTPGPLTRVATVRTSIYRGEPLAALAQIGQLTALPLSLADRSELLLLETWAQTLAGGPPDPTTARALAQLAIGAGHRRVFTTVPRSVVDTLAGLLEPSLAAPFRRLTDTMPFVPEVRPRPRLSSREREVLSAIATHGTVPAAASALYISPNTLKTHLAQVYRKLGATDRTQAIAIGAKFGLLQSPLPSLTDQTPSASAR